MLSGDPNRNPPPRPGSAAYRSDIVHNITPLIAPPIGFRIFATLGIRWWWPGFERRGSSDREDLPTRTTITVATIYVGRREDEYIFGRDQVFPHCNQYPLNRAHIPIRRQPGRE